MLMFTLIFILKAVIMLAYSQHKAGASKLHPRAVVDTLSIIYQEPMKKALFSWAPVYTLR